MVADQGGGKEEEQHNHHPSLWKLVAPNHCMPFFGIANHSSARRRVITQTPEPLRDASSEIPASRSSEAPSA